MKDVDEGEGRHFRQNKVSPGNLMRFDEKGLPVPGTMTLVVATNLCDNEFV